MKNRKENSIEEDILNNKKNKIKEDEVEINISKQTKIKGFFKKNFANKFDSLKVKYKKDPKKFVVVAAGLLLAFSSLIGSSYAYLTYVSKTNNSTVISAGTLAMNFKNETNAITLSNVFPQKDSDALSNNSEYEFTIENTGSISASYIVTLDNTCVQNKEYTINGEVVKADLCIPNEYIKVAIKEGTGDYKVIDYENSNDNNSYVIESGSLGAKQTKTYKMKIWLDYDTPNTYNGEGIKNVLYTGKLGLSYEQGANSKVVDISDSSGENAVYSRSTNSVYLGTALESISGYTTDYTTLNESFFLKHNIGSDNTVESQEVCYVLNETMYCLKGGAAGVASYEENKAILYSAFGEDNCTFNTTTSIYCTLSGITGNISGSGYAGYDDGNWSCFIDSSDQAYCFN